MDTRNKILRPEQAIEIATDLRERAIPYRAVTGFFDVLQPSLIEDLEDIAEEGAGLFAIVLDPPQTLMTAAARTELAAALRVVDYVVHLDYEPGEFIESLDPDEWIREEDNHLESTNYLIKHVVERQSERTK